MKYEEALSIAEKAHTGQVDKAGRAYIQHALHVAKQMDTEDAAVVAILHDVIEDTSIGFEYLRAQGLTKLQEDALRKLTREEGVSYMSYIEGIKENPLAVAVKLADLRHNMDISRLPRVMEEDTKRRDKYKKAYEVLCS